MPFMYAARIHYHCDVLCLLQGTFINRSGLIATISEACEVLVVNKVHQMVLGAQPF
jgi:hypothetical protein